MGGMCDATSRARRLNRRGSKAAARADDVPAKHKRAYHFLREHYARTTRRVQCRRAQPTIDTACLAPPLASSG